MIKIINESESINNLSNEEIDEILKEMNDYIINADDIGNKRFRESFKRTFGSNNFYFIEYARSRVYFNKWIENLLDIINDYNSEFRSKLKKLKMPFGDYGSYMTYSFSIETGKEIIEYLKSLKKDN